MKKLLKKEPPVSFSKVYSFPVLNKRTYVYVRSNMEILEMLFFEGANISISIFAVFEQRYFYKNSN